MIGFPREAGASLCGGHPVSPDAMLHAVLRAGCAPDLLLQPLTRQRAWLQLSYGLTQESGWWGPPPPHRFAHRQCHPGSADLGPSPHGPSFNILGAGPQGLAPWKRPGPVTRLLLFLLCRWETMLLQIYFNRASSDSLAPSNREALKMAFLSTASVARGPRGLKLALERA